MLDFIKLCSNMAITMNNDILVRGICILLNRFAYDFSPEQRNSIMEILSKNQPV